jgi:hypothetical protein
MEETAKNVDRLATIGARYSGRSDRWIIVPLYECASKKLGDRPISLVAAQRIIEVVKAGDRVLLVSDFASYPNMPFGETDGPLGVASLARAVRFGLGAMPVLVAGPRSIEALCHTTKAAGLTVLDYELAKTTTSAAAVVATFPVLDKEGSKKIATTIIDEYTPEAVISVETAGPNKKGIKHFGPGADMEATDRLPGLEYLFYESSRRGILTVSCIDQGNEIGSGTIEECVRRITPYGDVCRCLCKSGIACSVKTDIVFPAAISNWGAYAISAMLAFLRGKPEILQDSDTERRMLEACIMTGACDGPTGRPVMLVDAVSHQANEGMIDILHSIIENALVGSNIDSRFFKS